MQAIDSTGGRHSTLLLIVLVLPTSSSIIAPVINRTTVSALVTTNMWQRLDRERQLMFALSSDSPLQTHEWLVPGFMGKAPISIAPA